MRVPQNGDSFKSCLLPSPTTKEVKSLVVRYLPTKAEEEKLRQIINGIIGDILDASYPTKVEIVDVGSTAKGTWLLGESDIDLYLHSKDHYRTWKMVQKFYPEGHEKKGQLLIWNVKIEGYDVDLVVPSPYMNKREDTTKHTEYFRKHLTDEMRKEVREVKALFKTYGVYGSEIGGIVGVAIEQIIVMMDQANSQDRIKGLCSLLINATHPWIQDPTMTKPRNLLACIYIERWKQLQEVCREYRKTRTFTYNPMTTDGFLEKYAGTHCTLMYHRKLSKAYDYFTLNNAATHALKIVRTQEKEITGEFDAFVDNERIVLCYKIEPLELSKMKESCVSPDKADIQAFMNAHSNTYSKVETKELCTMVERKVVFPETFFSTEVARRMAVKGFKRW